MKSLKSLKIGHKEDFNLKKEDITASEIVRGLALNSTIRTFFYNLKDSQNFKKNIFLIMVNKNNELINH